MPFYTIRADNTASTIYRDGSTGALDQTVLQRNRIKFSNDYGDNFDAPLFAKNYAGQASTRENSSHKAAETRKERDNKRTKERHTPITPIAQIVTKKVPLKRPTVSRLMAQPLA